MTLPQLLDLLVGASPFAMAVFLIYLLITEQVVPKGRLDDQKALTKEATDGWKLSVTANERLADAWEARNEAEARLRQP